MPCTPNCYTRPAESIHLYRPFLHRNGIEVVANDTLSADLTRRYTREQLLELRVGIEIERAALFVAKLTLPGQNSAVGRKAEECFAARNREYLVDGLLGIGHVIHEAHGNGVVVFFVQGIGEKIMAGKFAAIFYAGSAGVFVGD